MAEIPRILGIAALDIREGCPVEWSNGKVYIARHEFVRQIKTRAICMICGQDFYHGSHHDMPDVERTQR